MLQFALGLVKVWGRRREMVMCAGVNFMFFLKGRWAEGNGDVCCS